MSIPTWLIEDCLGDDDDGEPIIVPVETTHFWMGDDDEGEPIFVEVP